MCCDTLIDTAKKRLGVKNHQLHWHGTTEGHVEINFISCNDNSQTNSMLTSISNSVGLQFKTVSNT